MQCNKDGTYGRNDVFISKCIFWKCNDLQVQSLLDKYLILNKECNYGMAILFYFIFFLFYLFILTENI